jgi:hypothetical protein
MSQFSTVANTAVVEDTNAPAISWSAIIAGSAVTIASSIVLTLLGVGLGFAFTPPSPDMHSAIGLSVAAIIWMIVVQWLSSALGGFLAGRLRLKWPGLHTHEVFFRDTAHGLLTWTLATLVMLAFFASAITAPMMHMPRHDNNMAGMEGGAPSHHLDPYLYRLYRVSGSSEAAPLTPGQRDESALLLVQSTGKEPLAAEDRAYLTHIVEAHTGMANADAEQRVDSVTAQLKADADKARKAAASAAIIAVLSMLIGAFIASVAAAIGGARRDEY